MYEKLRKARKAKKVKIKELTELIGIETAPAYMKKETGIRRFTVTEALIIAKRLGSTVEELFGD